MVPTGFEGADELGCQDSPTDKDEIDREMVNVFRPLRPDSSEASSQTPSCEVPTTRTYTHTLIIHQLIPISVQATGLGGSFIPPFIFWVTNTLFVGSTHTLAREACFSFLLPGLDLDIVHGNLQTVRAPSVLSTSRVASLGSASILPHFTAKVVEGRTSTG